jgi:AcrR family transcriptional regulator
MARPLEFEVEPVLDAAVEAFRHCGYGGTSIKSLEQATGLSSGSLYNSFGDKDAIFHRALARYTETVVAGRLAEHLMDNDPLAGLRTLFLTLLDEPGGGSFGCLLTNTAVECGPWQSEVGADVQCGFLLQEEALLAAVQRLVPFRPDAEQVSRRLLALYQGILVLIRSQYPKNRLREMIAFEFENLKG